MEKTKLRYFLFKPVLLSSNYLFSFFSYVHCYGANVRWKNNSDPICSLHTGHVPLAPIQSSK